MKISKMIFSFILPLLFVSIALPAQDHASFTKVAQKAIPAVVSIRVKTSSAQGNFYFGGQEGENDPFFQGFENDFFQQFFGAPRRERRPQQRHQIGQGSGFLVSHDGILLTNAHVVKEAEEITVILNDGREFGAKVLGEDPNTDVAILKIEASELPYLDLANSDNLEVGQWVVAIGNPLGLQASLTVGVVSAKGRNNLDIARIEDFIQTDAAINRGNSGGPLLNLDGEVVGMNTAIVTSMGTGGYMGIGFAIPSNMAQHVMQEILETGSVARGFMGVTLQNVDQGLSQALGLERVEGALIAEVSKNSPAEKAGLKQGDVILSYNRQPVKNIAQLRNAVSMMKPGTEVKLSILRNGRQLSVPLEVGEFPSEFSRGHREVELGLEVESITPEIAQNLGFIGGKGVVVTKVENGSPAAWAGFRKGTVIIAVNQKEIQNVEEFHQSVAATDEGKPILFLIKQGEATRYVSLKIN